LISTTPVQLSEDITQWCDSLANCAKPADRLGMVDGQFVLMPARQPLQHERWLVLFAPRITTSQVYELLSVPGFDPDAQLYPPSVYPHGAILLIQADLPVELKPQLAEFCCQNQLDFALLESLPTLKEPGVVLMDMDSTAIQIECIDEIAKLAGVGEQVSAVTARAMRGELDFVQSLRERVATLRGAPVGIIEQVVEQMPLMPGLTELVALLKQHDWTVAVASGGFIPFTSRLQQRVGLDANFANTLGTRDGVLTGEVLGAIVDGNRKAEIMVELREQQGVPLNQTVAIGDGANDLKMLAAAGTGVALHAKPVVQQAAKVAINHHDLEGVMALLLAEQCRSLSWC